MATLIEPQVLKGFRDSLPQQEIPKKALMAGLETVFESFGFVPIDTPVLEYTEVLLGKGGGETDKQVYRFEDHGGRDVSMRFDLTVPFARFMAANSSKLALPFKRYHMGKVWRGENTQRGRYREFVQCDFDIVGADTAAADFEILLMMTQAMDLLVGGKATIRLSHRGIFNRFLESLGARQHSVAVLRAVDKLAKIGAAEVGRLLGEVVSPEASKRILEYIGAKGDFLTVLTALESLAGGEADDTRRLRELAGLMTELGIAGRFVLDPSITRGLDYYTGIVYETFLDALPGLGSVMSGGRYNNLADLYTKEELPGVGASVGLDRLLAGLEELGLTAAVAGKSHVLVLSGTGGSAQKLAQELRSQGLNAEVYLCDKKVAQQYKYAEAKGIRFVAQVSEAGVNCKDTATGEARSGLEPKALALWVRSQPNVKA
ncbi:MAG: histidine--tRNA ligase [Spirochaetales bacterium]